MTSTSSVPYPRSRIPGPSLGRRNSQQSRPRSVFPVRRRSIPRLQREAGDRPPQPSLFVGQPSHGHRAAPVTQASNSADGQPRVRPPAGPEAVAQTDRSRHVASSVAPATSCDRRSTARPSASPESPSATSRRSAVGDLHAPTTRIMIDSMMQSQALFARHEPARSSRHHPSGSGDDPRLDRRRGRHRCPCGVKATAEPPRSSAPLRAAPRAPPRARPRPVAALARSARYCRLSPHSPRQHDALMPVMPRRMSALVPEKERLIASPPTTPQRSSWATQIRQEKLQPHRRDRAAAEHFAGPAAAGLRRHYRRAPGWPGWPRTMPARTVWPTSRIAGQLSRSGRSYRPDSPRPHLLLHASGATSRPATGAGQACPPHGPDWLNIALVDRSPCRRPPSESRPGRLRHRRARLCESRVSGCEVAPDRHAHLGGPDQMGPPGLRLRRPVAASSRPAAAPHRERAPEPAVSSARSGGSRLWHPGKIAEDCPVPAAWSAQDRDPPSMPDISLQEAEPPKTLLDRKATADPVDGGESPRPARAPAQSCRRCPWSALVPAGQRPRLEHRSRIVNQYGQVIGTEAEMDPETRHR